MEGARLPRVPAVVNATPTRLGTAIASGEVGRPELRKDQVSQGTKAPSKREASCFAVASDFRNPVPSRPVPSRPVPSQSSSGLNKSSVSHDSAETTDDDDHTRITTALPLIAEGLADLYEITPKRRPGYKAAILRNPADHQDALTVIANDNPGANPEQLAELYLATRRDAPDTTTQRRTCTRCHALSHTTDQCPLKERT